MKELEKRAWLKTSKFDEVFQKLSNKGRIEWSSRTRLMLDLSDSLEGRKRTVMLRIEKPADDDIYFFPCRLVTKTGGAGDEERQEASIDLTGNNLKDILQTLSIMGFKHASLGARMLTDGNMGNDQLGYFNYSFRQVVGLQSSKSMDFGYVLEIEVIEGGAGVEDLERELTSIGLEPLGSKQSIELFKSFHRDANLEFKDIYKDTAKIISVVNKHIEVKG